MNDRLSDLPSNKEERIRFFNDESNWSNVDILDNGLSIESLIFTNVVRISMLSGVDNRGERKSIPVMYFYVEDPKHLSFGPSTAFLAYPSQHAIDEWVSISLNAFRRSFEYGVSIK